MSCDKLVPFVSVIIPAYNEERYIRMCLKSVLSQDYPASRFDVLLVDNGSTDSTSQIAAELLAVNKRGLVLHKVGGTIASVRNFGSHNSKGEIIAFLDADSVVEPGWLSEGISLLKSANDISCVGFSAAAPNKEDSWVERAWFPISSSGKLQGTIAVRWLSSFNLILRRDIFEQVGAFDETLITCEDADLGNRLFSVSRIISSDRCRVRHLGGVKSINEFINKEYWRGQNSMRSFIKSNNNMAELLSITIPAIYLLLLVLLFVTLIISFTNYLSFIWPLIMLIVVIIVPILLAIRSGIRHPRKILFTATIFIFYLFSRGIALVNFRQ